MKRIQPRSILFVAAFICAALLAIVIPAQQPPGNGAALKSVLGKLTSKPSMIIVSPGEAERLFGGEDPCLLRTPIAYGQTINGILSGMDCRLDDGSYLDVYTFDGAINDRITVSLNATEFDAYLALGMENTTIGYEDDNGGDGTNALLSIVLPVSGSYVILANSALPNEFGSYALSLKLAPPCTYSVLPASATVPGIGGTYSFEVNAFSYCSWSAQSNNTPDLIVNPNNGNGSGTGNGVVSYFVNPNDTGQTRTMTISVAGQTFTVTQPSIECNFSIMPESVQLPGAETYGYFDVTATQGCSWNATNNDFFIWIDSPNPHVGSGRVNFHVIANNGPNERTGSISAGGKTFSIRQSGLNCTYSVSPQEIWLPSSRTNGTVSVDTQPGCTWMTSSNGQVLINAGIKTGPGTFTYSASSNPTMGPIVTVHSVYGGGVVNIPVVFRQAGMASRFRFDYDGDIRADLSVFRPSDGNWYLLRGTAGFMSMTYGEPGDKMVPADYDGDGKTDVAMFRPSNGKWYIFKSQSQSFTESAWGEAGDIPAPADHDGDGKADLVIFRPSAGMWYLRYADNKISQTQFGTAEDKPVIGDFDGDGRFDIGVFRASDNNWYLLKSTQGYWIHTWGESGDIPVPADYDGDAKTDIAIFRPSTGQWYRILSASGFDERSWGQDGDKPVPADYDGDGKADIGVFRLSNATWYILGTMNGQIISTFGTSEDIPTPNSLIN